MGPMCGVPFVGEEGVGHLTLGNPRGIKRRKEKARQRYLSAWAVQSAIPSVEEQRLVVFTMWAKKCSEKWLQVESHYVQLGVLQSNPIENAPLSQL